MKRRIGVSVMKCCPVCGNPLRERVHSTNGARFLGCSQFPTCTHREPLPESVRLRRDGQAELPLCEEDR